MSAAETHRGAGRIVVKIGSALLVDRETGLRRDWLETLVADVAAISRSGRAVPATTPPQAGAVTAPREARAASRAGAPSPPAAAPPSRGSRSPS